MSLDRRLQEYLRHLTVERGLSKNTLLAYKRDLNRYVSFLQARGIDEIQGIDSKLVAAFSQSLGQDENMKTSSVARILSAVRGLHKFWLFEGFTEADPSSTVTPPKVRQNLPHPIAYDDLLRLLDAAGPSVANAEIIQLEPVKYRNRALVELLFSTGGRISEVLALDLDDIKDNQVTLTGKGAKQRVSFVGKEARDTLNVYLVRVRPALAQKGKGSPALFLNHLGGRLSRQSAWQIVSDAAKAIGLEERVSPHSIRHTFATIILQNSRDIRGLQDMLGHASVTTTQIYTKVTAEEVRDTFRTRHPRARR
jgi:integrase/recombinase XerD